jgi:peptide/nickel transport system substrate-binding protein
VDGERSSIKTKHFAFSDPAVREAMSLLADRKSIQDFIYGRTGTATSNFLNNPSRYRSPNTKMEFNIDKANALLDAAGWKKGSDGIREKGGKKMRFVYQTSVNTLRQKEQAVIKQAAQKAGVDLELKSVTASVFFSSDVANTDTYGKFYADMQMYTTTMTQPDPERFMDQYVSWEVSSKANKWQGRNIVRWTSEAYDKAYRAAESELDPIKRTALFVQMNDLPCKDNVIIPLISRPRVRGANLKLQTVLSGFDLDFAQLHDWYREA